MDRRRARKAAARIHLEATHDRASLDEMRATMNAPKIEFSPKPMTIDPMVMSMAKTGSLCVRPRRRQDTFLAEAQAS
jgi:hypothetical protein